jgi:hypothetical protein
MKWMLVVLVGGMTPVNTDLVFDKFADCLAAEEQMRKHYTDAFEAWDRWAAANMRILKGARPPGQTAAQQHRYLRSSRRRRGRSASATEQSGTFSASHTCAAAKSENVTFEPLKAPWHAANPRHFKEISIERQDRQ